MELISEITTTLKKKKIRPSFQRIKVLEYLYHNQCHPTVDQIYQNLQNEIPTLSKSTIYNTLDAFLKAGIVKLINIEDNETRYDIITKEHGHFKCEVCGEIYNFSIDLNFIQTEELFGYRILDKNVYFKGICGRCLLDKKERKE